MTLAHPLRISVIMPVYNAERFVGAALRSVFEQTRAPDEIIVVDDGSTDGTPQLLSEFQGEHRSREGLKPGLPDHPGAGIVVLRQDNQGAGAARNLAVERSQGDLLAFLDADDLWLPGSLRALEAALMARPELDLVFGHVEQIRDAGVADTEGAAAPAVVGPSMQGYIPSAMMLRRETFDRVGPFDLDRQVPEFATWFLRAQEIGVRLDVVPDVVAWRRLHEANKGRTNPHARQEYVRALKRSLDRRRTAQLQDDTT